MAHPDILTLNRLKDILYAYVDTFGEADSPEELRAIAGSILTLEKKAKRIKLMGLEIEEWVEDLVAAYKPSEIKNRAFSIGQRAIAEQVKTWRDGLITPVLDTLSAYLKTQQSTLTPTELPAVILTILPLIETGQMTRDQATAIVQQVVEEFDLPSILSRLSGSPWVKVAKKVATCLRHYQAEQALGDILQAYRQEFQPPLVEVGEHLVEQALAGLLGNRANFDLDIDLDADTQRLLIQQVSFKLHFNPAAPPPSKTAAEIAQQIHSEVQRYRREHGLDTVDYIPAATARDLGGTASQLGTPMEIGIEILPARKKND